MSSHPESIDGSSFEIIYRSQVEQRTGHHLNSEEESHLLSQNPIHNRRTNEARDSTDSRPSIRQSIRGRSVSPGPNPNHTWLSYWKRPWQSLSTTFIGIIHYDRFRSRPSWWYSTSRAPISPETPSQSRPARALFRARIQLISSVSAILTSKRRKTWFLFLIVFSLLLTILSANYLLGRLHHSSDLSTSTQPNGVKQEVLVPEPVDSGSGSRRDRKKGKGGKNRPRPKKPSGDKPNDQHSTDLSDSETKLELHRGKNPETDSGESSEDNNKDDSNIRICNLNDLVNGHWSSSENTQLSLDGNQGSSPADDQSWTGYGPLGCRSHIWNERYLLTPNVNSLTSTLPLLTSASVLDQNRKYAAHVKGFSWVLDHNQSGDTQSGQHKPTCRQPDMDVGDFIEVLKRSPLVMIGDKFLEQEFLSLECMAKGLQDQLMKEYRLDHQEVKETDNEAIDRKILDYQIESEMPPTVELKIAPGQDAATSNPRTSPELSSQSSPPTLKAQSSSIYRKAKPGRMKLLDRKSNFSLATFIRSDVLWDSGMFSSENTDFGGLHPDCKLVGPVLMCEPPPRTHEAKLIDGLSTSSHKGSWFGWWIGNQDQPPVKKESNKEKVEEGQITDESTEFWFGSDLERDMINLGWVDMLREAVNAEEGAFMDSKGTRRTPLLVISNGVFWDYDPLDALLLDEAFRLRQQQGGFKTWTKVEKERILKLQDSRRKLLRRRYTTVLSHTLEYLKATYPEMRVIVQTSVRRHQDCMSTGSAKPSAAEKAIRDDQDREAALLNELTRVIRTALKVISSTPV